MAKRVYLIWKDPTAPKTDDNWIQLSGKEFQEFCKTESARQRYFIRMGDDVRDRCAGGQNRIEDESDQRATEQTATKRCVSA